ncbi:MAG TPA: M28 family peptidase [bacterium]
MIYLSFDICLLELKVEAIIKKLIKQVNQKQLSACLFFLAKELRCRTLNYASKGHEKCTLYEADYFIQGKLESFGYKMGKEAVPVQAFVHDTSVPYGFRKPLPDEPWHIAFNLYFKKTGAKYPDELIVALAHKDSQSWLDRAPGAYDNAVGTCAVMEIARILANYQSQRSIWFLFCNEEHWQWTSVAAAQNIAKLNLNVVAVLNIDSLGGKSQQDISDKKLTNVTRYSTREGEKLADLMVEINLKYQIGLEQKKYFCAEPNDDDGSFVRAGFPASVLNIGSFPYADPNYHSINDKPEYVDLFNVKLATQLSLAFLAHLDQS